MYDNQFIKVKAQEQGIQVPYPLMPIFNEVVEDIVKDTYSKEEVLAILNSLKQDTSGYMQSMTEVAHNERFNSEIAEVRKKVKKNRIKNIKK
jgi:hypothetical protein